MVTQLKVGILFFPLTFVNVPLFEDKVSPDLLVTVAPDRDRVGQDVDRRVLDPRSPGLDPGGDLSEEFAVEVDPDVAVGLAWKQRTSCFVMRSCRRKRTRLAVINMWILGYKSLPPGYMCQGGEFRRQM